MAYSATGETWMILAYEQLQLFATQSSTAAFVEYTNQLFVVKNFFTVTVTSNADMTAFLTGTNCNRPGVYAHPINKGDPTKAPTKAPTKTPTKAPTRITTKTPSKSPTTASTRAKCGLFGWSLFCTLTRCGVLGSRIGRCNA